jgi:hypothetical protein
MDGDELVRPFVSIAETSGEPSDAERFHTPSYRLSQKNAFFPNEAIFTLGCHIIL